MAGRLPDFLIIGAPKSGTTSLYHYLTQHPQIFMSSNKEPYFFAFEGSRPTFCGPGDEQAWINAQSVVNLSDYQQLFTKARDDQQCGEASTMYLYVKESCDRIYHYIPQAKLIAFLRHPVDRAYSHYKHLRRDGREWESDFSQSMRKEHERIEQGWSPAWHYRQVGNYCEQIKRFQQCFGPSQLKIFLYDDLVSNPQKLCCDLFEFIKVDSSLEIDTSKRHNTTTAVRKNKAIHNFLTQPSKLKSTLRQVVPAHIRKPLSAKVYRKNAKSIASLSDALRSELTDSFRAEILQLQDLIDRDLSHWLTLPSNPAMATNNQL